MDLKLWALRVCVYMSVRVCCACVGGESEHEREREKSQLLRQTLRALIIQSMNRDVQSESWMRSPASAQ